MPTRLIAGILAAIIWPLAAASTAQGTALVDRVLVIRNTNSPISKAIANDYMQRRGVTRMVDVDVPDGAVNNNNETIGFADFQNKIQAPLRIYLMDHPEIDFIVTTKGVPLRLNGAQPNNSISLDSYLAAWDYDKVPGAIRIIINIYDSYTGMGWSNRYWNSKARFSHAAFGGYLVTRLDGYTQAEAMGLTTRSLAAESALAAGKTPTGKILFDESARIGTTSVAAQPYSVLKANPPVNDTSRIPKESEYGDYNSDMALAHETLMAHKIPDTLNTDNTFVGHLNGLMGYISWGSNDGNYDASTYNSLGFDNGGIGETAVSTSARTFLPTSGGQSLIVDLIHHGITCIKGYCDEPYLQACASPSILFGRYTQGWTMAESYYAASNLVGWEDIVVGDPIARAYPDTSPAAFIAAPAETHGPAGKYSLRLGKNGALILAVEPTGNPSAQSKGFSTLGRNMNVTAQ